MSEYFSNAPTKAGRMPVTPTMACTLPNPCDCDDLRFSSECTEVRRHEWRHNELSSSCCDEYMWDCGNKLNLEGNATIDHKNKVTLSTTLSNSANWTAVTSLAGHQHVGSWRSMRHTNIRMRCDSSTRSIVYCIYQRVAPSTSNSTSSSERHRLYYQARPGILHVRAASARLFFWGGGGGSLATFAIRGYAQAVTVLSFLLLHAAANHASSHTHTHTHIYTTDTCRSVGGGGGGVRMVCFSQLATPSNTCLVKSRPTGLSPTLFIMSLTHKEGIYGKMNAGLWSYIVITGHCWSISSEIHLTRSLINQNPNILITKAILEIEKGIVCEIARGDKHQLRKSSDRKAQISPLSGTNALLICAFV